MASLSNAVPLQGALVGLCGIWEMGNEELLGTCKKQSLVELEDVGTQFDTVG